MGPFKTIAMFVGGYDCERHGRNLDGSSLKLIAVWNTSFSDTLIRMADLYHL